MTFRTVLAVIGASTPDGFLSRVAELSHRAAARLSVLVVTLAAPPPIGDYAAMISDAWFEEQEDDRHRLDAKIATVRGALSNAGSFAETDGLYCDGVRARAEVGRRAMYADVVLIGDAEVVGGELRRYAIDAALFEARRPVLLLPQSAQATLVPQRIVLGWDGRPDAAAAARQTIDLMRNADMVDVVMVDPVADANGRDEGATTEIACYLSHHDIKVTVDNVASSGRSIADVLQQRAAQLSADLIVMGAYGHTRLRERIFGGVTQSMIDAVVTPVLLAR
jgi:nucleotide-binding universal stress UspA family protein